MSTRTAYAFVVSLITVCIPISHVRAHALKSYLDQINYCSAVKKLYGASYKKEIIDEDKQLTISSNLGQIQGDRTQLALKYFHLVEFLNQREMKRLFRMGDKNAQEALRWLDSQRINLKSDDRFNLNDMRIHCFELANKSSIYILADRSDHFQKEAQTAFLSKTSLLTLWRIEDYFENEHREWKGLAADFGSGVGLLGLAVLRLYPGIQKVYGLEIDARAMHLSNLNAAINDLGARYQVLNNQDPKRLTKTLNGQKIALAVSNPPFNIVPNVPEITQAIGAFGSGGETGLDVTSLFIDQFIENSFPGSDFIFYSQLALNDDDIPILQSRMKTHMRANEKVIDFTAIAEPTLEFENIEGYVAALVEFYNSKKREKLLLGMFSKQIVSLNQESLIAKRAVERLKENHISSIKPFFVRVGGFNSLQTERSTKSVLKNWNPALEPRGGAYMTMTRMGTGRELMGGGELVESKSSQNLIKIFLKNATLGQLRELHRKLEKAGEEPFLRKAIVSEINHRKDKK